MKREFSYVHCMEDVWIDLCSEVDVVEDDNKILDKNFIIVNWRSSFLF